MPRHFVSMAIALAASVAALNPAGAEIPNQSKEDLLASASHAFTGTVLRTDERKEQQGNYDHTHGVAEMAVERVAKGTDVAPGDRVSVRYWRKRWIGDGHPPPGHFGHRNVPAKGDVAEVYVKGDRKAGFDVLSPNGFFSVTKGDASGKDRPAEKAGADPDLSTARSAALAWLDAAWVGDEAAAHQVLMDDERQRQFMANPLHFAAARRALEAAAVERFGEAGPRVSGYPDGSAKAMGKRLDLKEDGDRATASFADAILTLHLRRVDGRWRVDLSETLGDPLARRAADASAAAAKVAEEVTAEIAAGMFATAEEARKAFRERRLAAVRK